MKTIAICLLLASSACGDNDPAELDAGHELVDASLLTCWPAPGSVCAAVTDAAIVWCERGAVCYPEVWSNIGMTRERCFAEAVDAWCKERDCAAEFPYEKRELLDGCLGLLEQTHCVTIGPPPDCSRYL